MGDDTGFVSAFTGDLALSNAIAATPVVSESSVPDSQTDFNSVGTSDITSVLSGGTDAIKSIISSVGAINQARASVAVNSAIAAQAQATGLQQVATSGKIATLQASTALAQAQAAYNKAAGVLTGSPNTLLIVLTVAGLAIAAAQLVKRK